MVKKSVHVLHMIESDALLSHLGKMPDSFVSVQKKISTGILINFLVMIIVKFFSKRSGKNYIFVHDDKIFFITSL